VGESQTTSRETVRVLTALSDENRFRIVELLAGEEEELSCGAIGKALDISPSLLSHHLAILADAEIIGRRKNGLWTMNVLQRDVIERQVRTLQALIGSGNGELQNGHAQNGHVEEGFIRLHRVLEQDSGGS
jgi:DNA-binding transcriptional ArsR family regulator